MGIDLVGEDVLCEGEGHGKIEALEQLEEGLALAADEHGEAVRAVDCGGDAAHRFEHAEGDLSVVDQVGEMRQKVVIDGGLLLYACANRSPQAASTVERA